MLGRAGKVGDGQSGTALSVHQARPHTRVRPARVSGAGEGKGCRSREHAYSGAGDGVAKNCFNFLRFRRLIGTVGWAGEVGGLAAGVDCFWIKDEEDQVWRWEGSRAQICSRLWEEEDASSCKWRCGRRSSNIYKERVFHLPSLISPSSPLIMHKFVCHFSFIPS